jgi:GNAT superfamily N-acetyltransferase
MDAMSTTPGAVAGHSWRIASEDGDRLTVIAFTPDDDQAAGVTLSFATQATGEHRAMLEGEVGVDHRRRGLGTAILVWAQTAAREHFAGALGAGESVTFRVDVDAPGDDAARLYGRHGLVLAVAEDEMTRPLVDIPEVPIPPEYTVRHWDRMSAPLFYHAYDSAFRDRPGFPGWDESRWCATYTGSDDFQPRHCLVVLDGPEPAGYAVCWIEADTGWIIQMGVRPEWRGQGLGAAILSQVMQSFAEAGLKTAALEVATNNPTARRLYERLGFERTHAWQSWRKALAAGG